jgi:antitoxin StbD
MNKPFLPEPVVPILADVGIGISDLKRNPAAAIAAARVQQVAVLNRNKPVAYLVSPEVWEQVLDVLDDLKLGLAVEKAFVEDAADAIEVSIDEL